MWCLVSLSNAVNLDIEVDPKGKGQECLDQVCSRLGIIEEDYFGLQYRCPRGEVLWLNMRNLIRHQVPGPLPYRLSLRVKFFVPPQLILQDTTRHQFYLHVKWDLSHGQFLAQDRELVHLLAYIAQAEWGDCHLNRCICKTAHIPANCCCYSGLLQNGQQKEKSFWDDVAKSHKTLKGWTKTKAEYWLLKEASGMKSYGEEHFPSKISSGEGVVLGVGPEGLNIYNEDTWDIIQSIPYQCIHIATHTGKCFFLKFLTDGIDHEPQHLAFKFEGTKAANSIYRAVTEKHAFYNCDTVRRSVTSQYIRDLKGTILSLFNENTALGKNYVFDVRLTCREVYDNARRALYQASCEKEKLNAEYVLPSSVPDNQKLIHNRRRSACYTDDEEGDDREECTIEGSDECEEICKRPDCLAMREQIAGFQDAMLCRICMDSDINSAFIPCRHVVCCDSCALRCERCPFCRSSIDYTQFVYLPFSAHRLPP